ncbi:hypothetical protein [Pseudomonas viridiflava]|uniref:hypothetical protein n=1 Tax=Pseudomonas viridiflava TaxID=33069 RepID=UPI0039B97676
MLHIMDAELIEGNYVLYQGDLSTNCVYCWEKLIHRGHGKATAGVSEQARTRTFKIGENADPQGPQARL